MASIHISKGKINYDSNNLPTSFKVQIIVSNLAVGSNATERRIEYEFDNGSSGSYTFSKEGDYNTEYTKTISLSEQPSSVSIKLEYQQAHEGSGYIYYTWEIAIPWTQYSIIWPPFRWTKWDNLEAENTIIQSSTGITANDWNEFTARINQMRSYQGVSSHNFTKVNSGDLITTAIYNDAVIYIGRPESERNAPEVEAEKTLITADSFINLAKDLNWYL